MMLYIKNCFKIVFFEILLLATNINIGILLKIHRFGLFFYKYTDTTRFYRKTAQACRRARGCASPLFAVHVNLPYVKMLPLFSVFPFLFVAYLPLQNHESAPLETLVYG